VQDDLFPAALQVLGLCGGSSSRRRKRATPMVGVSSGTEGERSMAGVEGVQ